jgi:preprotein translocase subunit SecA
MVEALFGKQGAAETACQCATSEKLIDDIEDNKQNFHLQFKEEEFNYHSFADQLSSQWEELDKGGEEELEWTKQTVAMVGGAFERYQREVKGIDDFQLRRNQLEYITLMLLSKGEYEFGVLETDNRGVELPTGEGKTFGMGLSGLIRALRGEKVVIVEPNYLSASDHAHQLGEFFHSFGLDIGVLTSNYNEIGTPATEVYQANGFSKVGGIGAEKRAWSKDLVYVDPDRCGFDYLKDQRIGSKQRRIDPQFHRRTAIIGEADRLLIDEASSPWVISKEISKPEEVWDLLGDISGIKKKDADEKRELTKFLFHSLWKAFNQNRSNFKQGEDGDYLLIGGSLQFGESMQNKIDHLLTADVFQFMETHTEEDIQTWKNNNFHVVNALLKIMLAVKENVDYVGTKDGAVLLDDLGIPLAKRRLSLLENVFLQLHRLMGEQDQADAGKKLNQIKVLVQRERLPRTILWEKFATLLGTSGSMVPAEETFKSIFAMEVKQVPRHLPVELGETVDRINENSLVIECLDSGGAAVNFYADRTSLRTKILERIKQLKDKKRSGMVIMPDINEVRLLEQLIGDQEAGLDEEIKVVTGAEEIDQQGALTEAVETLQPGELIITTQMAHRDVDINQDTNETAGPEVIVVGFPSSERNLWQALQRAGRGDLPGTRRLMVSREDLEAIYKSNILKRGLRIRRYNKNKEQLLKQLDQALESQTAAQEDLFTEIVRYLRWLETERKRTLKIQLLKEGNLEGWKRLVINSMPAEDAEETEKVREQWAGFLSTLDLLFNQFVHSERINIDDPAGIERVENLWNAEVIKLIESSEQ